MSIDRELVWDIDAFAEGIGTEDPQGKLNEKIEQLRSQALPLCRVTCGPGSSERLRDILCRLRAEGLGALVLIRGRAEISEEHKAVVLFETLRDWDQLLLRNILEVGPHWIPREHFEALRQEAKAETKWFEQWHVASHDSQIHRYPTLPWRSFLRKINAENYQFIVDLIQLSHRPSNAESKRAISDHIHRFLDAKKKTICVFPKRWN